ncbi:hypothetical protein Unana1_04844 [Umbelopsis nana]
MVQKIKAIGLHKTGTPSVLEALQIEDPTPGPTDVKVRVKAVSINPFDAKLRDGHFPMPFPAPWVLGYDASGVVEGVGSNVTRFKVGDEVYYSGTHTRQGANAEVHVVDEKIVGRKPKSISHASAAAFPMGALTAWTGIVEKLALPLNGDHKNKSILIIAGAGGVGSFAIQLARRILGFKTVIATASRPESIKWCEDQGATHVVNHRNPLKEQIDALGVKIDYALNCHDTNAYLATLVDIVQPFGHIISIVDVSCDMPFGGGMIKGQSFHWVFAYGKSLYGIDELSVGLALDKIADYIDKGVLKRLDNKVYDKLTVKCLRKVHEEVESGRSVGKIVVELGPGSFE